MKNYLLKSPFLLLHSKKCFCTTSSLYGKQTASAFRKVLHSPKRKSVFYEDAPSVPISNVFGNGTFEAKRITGNPRRPNVLNKLFMRHITDLMATGECSKEFVGHGIEVNKIKISPNYQMLKVYWIAKGNEKDEIISDLLHKNAGLLRHELSQLKLIGNVPYIQFIKDKTYAFVAEVDNKLAKADFGEEHEPLDDAHKLKNELEMFSEQTGNQHLKNTDEIEDSFPSMPQNVLGLDHAAILKRIVTNMSKNKRKVRPKGGFISSLLVFNENPVEYKSHQERREAFKQFLHQREIMRTKANKNEKYTPDMQYMEEENRGNAWYAINAFNNEEKYEEDFIEENEDN